VLCSIACARISAENRLELFGWISCGNAENDQEDAVTVKPDGTKRTPEAELRSLINRFDPKEQKVFRSVRAAVRKRFPRFIRVDAAGQLGHPDVEALIGAAIDHATVPLPAKGKGKLIIQSSASKRRPRRKSTK